jgi:hypothetical protein
MLMRNRITALDANANVEPEQRILIVVFQSADGRRWEAIGGGTTVAAAIVSARDSCPDGASRETVHWNDLYGE